MLLRAALLILLALVVEPAAGADYATQAVDATYKLYNKASTATGFFVREPDAHGISSKGVIVVTAAHVLSHMTGDTMLVVLRDPAADGSFKRRDFSVPIRAKNKPLWTAHAKEDVAVMRVLLPENAHVTPLPFDSLVDEKTLKEINLHVASPLVILGFPARYEGNDAGFPVARHASVASFPLLPVKIYKTFIADFATFAGDSGGPVFMPDSRRKDAAETSPPLVIGIVLAQVRQDEKVKTLTEEGVVHHPLQLAKILHAQYVRQTIEQLPKR